MEERRVAEDLLALRVVVVVDAAGRGAEGHGEQVPGSLDGVVHAGSVQGRGQGAGEFQRPGVDERVHLGRCVGERRYAGRHRYRVPGEGAGLVDRAHRREVVHDLGAAAEGRRRHAAAYHLAEGQQVRGPRLGRVGRPAGEAPVAGIAGAEAGEDLIEDQQGAVFAGDPGQPGVEALARGHHAHVGRRGLRDDSGDAVSVLGEGGLDGVEVVVGQHEGFGGGRGGDAGGAGQRERSQARPGGGEQAVKVAVVAAGELDHQVATGVAAGKPDGGHGRLGAGGDHPDPLGCRDALLDDRGEVGLVRGRGAEGQSAVDGGVHRREDLRVGVAQQRRAPGADQVDVLGAVGVGEVRALGGDHEAGRAAHRAEGPDRRVDAARHQAAGTVEEFLIARVGGSHGSYSFSSAGNPALHRPARQPPGAPPRCQTVRWSASWPHAGGCRCCT